MKRGRPARKFFFFAVVVLAQTAHAIGNNEYPCRTRTGKLYPGDSLFLEDSQFGGGNGTLRGPGPFEDRSVTLADGTKARIRFDGKGEGMVEMRRPGTDQWAPSFLRTNRTRAELQFEFPGMTFELAALAGKRVLDHGCGSGAFVFEMQKAKVDAHGIDLLLTKRQRNGENFVESDAIPAPYGDGSFDVIYTNYSVLFYDPLGKDERKNPSLGKKATEQLKDFHRLLAPGGVLRIGGVNVGKLRKSLLQFPDLEIVAEGRGLKSTWVEVRKKKS